MVIPRALPAGESVCVKLTILIHLTSTRARQRSSPDVRTSDYPPRATSRRTSLNVTSGPISDINHRSKRRRNYVRHPFDKSVQSGWINSSPSPALSAGKWRTLVIKIYKAESTHSFDHVRAARLHVQRCCGCRSHRGPGPSGRRSTRKINSNFVGRKCGPGPGNWLKQIPMLMVDLNSARKGLRARISSCIWLPEVAWPRSTKEQRRQSGHRPTDGGGQPAPS